MRIGKADEYHQHLETCRQCAEEPFNLCSLGIILLIGAATDALAMVEVGKQRVQQPRPVRRKAGN